MSSPLTVTDFYRKRHFRYLQEIPPAVFYRTVRDLIPAAEEHPVAPIATLAIQRARHRFGERLRLCFQSLQPVLRNPNLGHHLRFSRKRPELLSQQIAHL